MKTTIQYTSFFLRVLFLTIMGLWILGQFGRFELSGGRAIYMHDIALLLFVGSTALLNWKGILQLLASTPDTQEMVGKKQSQEFIKKEHKDKPFPEQPSVLTWLSKDRFLFFAFLGFNFVVVLNSVFFFQDQPTHLLTGLLYLIRFDTIIAFGVGAFSLLKSNVFTKQEVNQTLTVSLIATATLGFAQYFLFPDTRQLVLLGWDDHYYRMIGTIFDPGFLGIILAISSLLFLSQLANQQTSLSQRLMSLWLKLANYPLSQLPSNLATYASFLLFTLALLLTYSRASYVAFAVGVMLIALSQRSIRALLIIPLFAASIFLLPRPGGEGVNLARTASIHARIESNQQAVNTFSATNILFGQGWYHTKANKPVTIMNGEEIPNHSSAPENSFIFIFSSLGIVGLAFWLGMLGSLFLLVGPTSSEGTLLVAVGVHALFSNTLFHPFVLILLAVITAKKLASVL